MAQNDDLSSLERVRQRLYNPQAQTGFEEPHLTEERATPATGWSKLRQKEYVEQASGTHMSGPVRFFIIAFVFFILTAGGAAFYLIWGGRTVSTDNVIITTEGPTTIASGDTVPLLITIENKNPVAIRAVTLSLDFPEGTKDPVDPTKPLSNYSADVGDIQPGAKVEETVKATLFGSEGQQVSLPIKAEYHTDSSSSVFVKDKQYGLTVTTSPLALTVTSLTQVSAGQPVTVDVSVRSNATTNLDNVAVSAAYPFGFTPSSATPTPGANNLFALGTFGPGEEKHISIAGTLSGENNDERVFTFTAGTLSATDSPTLATSYTSKEADILITKPFLATTLTINHDSTDSPVIQSGINQQALVTWVNTLSSQLTNGTITVALSGDALDPTSIGATDGFFRSSDTTVLFSSETAPGLASLQPGDTGNGIINFSTKKGAALQALRNPTITFKISVAGQRIGESNVPENISSTITRVAKVGTNLALSTKIVHSIGSFPNTGPWPPVPNSETTYTVEYALTNTVNSVAGAKVVAKLPTYVRFTGQMYPSDGSITYNDSTRTVTWTAGDIPAGTATPVTASFQIGFTPSTSQSGTNPVLLFAQEVDGVDRFTQAQISGSLQELTTQTSSDPAYVRADGAVQ